MRKSFDNAWDEYIEKKKEEAVRLGAKDPDAAIYELIDMEDDFRDFYTFLKCREEI